MERKEASLPVMPHQVVLHQRNLLDLEGVIAVEHFDEATVVVCTSLGELSISGNGLHVRQLNLESGSLSVEGCIDSLVYREIAKRSGLFSRILR